MCNSGQMLREHVADLRRQLKGLGARLSTRTDGDPLNAQRISDATQRLRNVCAIREFELTSLETDLSRSGTVTDQWTRLVAISQACRAFAADCLALEQRLSLAATPGVKDLCGAADRICEEFSNKIGQSRYHYAVVSEAEHFGANASAVHLSYARLDPWHLSRAVHEFGHLWAEEFGSKPDGAQTNFTSAIERSWEKALAKEFFADLVATFLTGPAYAYSCLLLDFNPADRVKSETHPSADERAFAILTALDLLVSSSDEFTRPQMRVLAQQLRTFWNTARTEAGAGGSLQISIELESAIDIAIKRLASDVPNAQYRDLSRANAVANNLANGGGRPPDASCADILNGAWLQRLNRPEEAVVIGKKAVSMFITH